MKKKKWRRCISARWRRRSRVQKEVLDFFTKSHSQHHGGEEHLEKEEEDARLLDRCEAKRKEWSVHWHGNEEVQNTQEKPWRNEELERWEEALSRSKESELEKASRKYKAKTGVGCDGFHPRVPLDLTKDTEGGNVE